MKDTTKRMPMEHEKLTKPILLSVLSIFEVTFDILSLVAALLGGFLRENSKGKNTDVTAGVVSEEVDTSAPQLIINETLARRPIGVILISIFLGLLGIFDFGFGLLTLITSLVGHLIILPLSSAAAGGAIGVYYMLAGLVKLFFVWGLWRLQRWAFWATVFIAAVSLLSNILVMAAPPSTVWEFLVELLVPTMILIYLIVDSRVRTAFQV